MSGRLRDMLHHDVIQNIDLKNKSQNTKDFLLSTADEVKIFSIKMRYHWKILFDKQSSFSYGNAKKLFILLMQTLLL